MTDKLFGGDSGVVVVDVDLVVQVFDLVVQAFDQVDERVVLVLRLAFLGIGSRDLLLVREGEGGSGGGKGGGGEGGGHGGV